MEEQTIRVAFDVTRTEADTACELRHENKPTTAVAQIFRIGLEAEKKGDRK